MTDLLEMQFIELNKLRQVDKASPITFWIEFFRNPYSESVKALCDYVPEIKEAKQIYEKAKTDPKLREIIETREKATRDYSNDISCAKEEGREEGREEGIAIGEEKGREEGIAIGEEKGREEGKRETAIKLLSMGLHVDQIATATGLSEEEIESLKSCR
jgi:predicted transposase/invertase (TIGR01784 family)